MHLTRQESSKMLPIPRKGTKYVVRSLSKGAISVPVLIALRDIIKLAQREKEVASMIKSQQLKLNGKIIKNYREAISLFSILEAGKSYKLTILPTKKLTFEETKDKERLCKVLSRRLVKNNKIQLNLHDGTNLISKDDVKVGDSLYLDFSGKIKKHIPLLSAKECFVFLGKYSGQTGKIEEVKDSQVKVKFNGGMAMLDQSHLFAL